jgi:hypothetical protein
MGMSEAAAAALPAAEPPARRSPRKPLGPRVGTASTGAPARADGPAGSKPERKAEPSPKADGQEEDRDRDRNRDKDEDRDTGKDDRGRELHRPRRQRDDRSPAKGRRGHRGSDRASKAGKASKAKHAKRPRIRAAVAGSGTALKRGAVETRRRVAVAAPKVGRRGLAILGAIFAIFFELLGFVRNVLIAVGRLVARPVGWVLVRLRRLTDATSRLLTPKRVLALVVAGAAVLLALSQYADYRSISIGNDAYSGVQNIAPPPETGRLQTGDAHSYVFVPLAILCLLLLAGAVAGRWRLCRLISLVGAAAIVVAILLGRRLSRPIQTIAGQGARLAP